MADKDTARHSPYAFDPAGFQKLGEKQAEAFAAMQRELYGLVEEANKSWVKRTELEREMANELVTHLQSAKSLPDAAKAYQDWMTRRMQTLTEDGQKLFAESQKFIAAATRFMSAGHKPD
jgi:ABC-type amino acid transport substrate-binding protein